MSSSMESDEEASSNPNEIKIKQIQRGSVTAQQTDTTTTTSPTEFLNRRLGSNEVFAYNCSNAGNLNTVCGLTLLTRHSIDEGRYFKLQNN